MFSVKIILAAILSALFVLNLSWRNCVKLCLFLVVIEGALRKWVFPQASEFIYFAKDAVIIVAYLKFYSSHSFKQYSTQLIRNETLKILLLISAGFILLQIFNMNSGSPIVGVLGARNYLLYAPLMFICSELFESQEDLARFLRRYLLITIPVFILAVYQNRMPAAHWINTYVATAADVSHGYIGTSVRVTSTFSYIAGYTSYLLTCAALVIPLLIVVHPLKWKITFILILLSVTAGMLLSGSRGPVVGMGLFMLGYIVINANFRRLGLYKRLIIPVFLATSGIIYWFSSLLSENIARLLATQDLNTRIVATFLTPFTFIQHSGLIGFGVGSTYQALPRLRELFGVPYGTYIPIFYESEPERIMLELGPVGFLIWYALRIGLLIALYRTHKRLTMPLFRELALTAFLLHMVLLPGQTVFQITALVYYWFTAGFIFLLPRLEAKELAKYEEVTVHGG